MGLSGVFRLVHGANKIQMYRRCITATANHDYNKVLKEIVREVSPLKYQGQVASYIPELALVNPSKFGMHIHAIDGTDYGVGDNLEKFSLQSISKVFALTLAVSNMNSVTFERVGVEPSGNPFNSLVQLEQEKGIPRNPFINAGAIVVCDILLDQFQDPKKELLNLVRLLSGNPSIDFNLKVAESERQTGFRNFALGNFMRSFGNLHHDVEKVLDLYFHMCAIEMSCKDLATSFSVFANEGRLNSRNGEPPTVVMSKTHVRRINAVMQTCGFYDEAGEVAYLIGLPGKSGVGGGIVAVHPRQYAVATWSPRLNKKGNSVMGMKALELLTEKLDISIF
jgi:glutaminase